VRSAFKYLAGGTAIHIWGYEQNRMVNLGREVQDERGIIGVLLDVSKNIANTEITLKVGLR
jgi:hypothetical protein